jgi:hypothetical protein
MPYGRHENAAFGFWVDGRATPEPASSLGYRERATRLRALAADSPDAQIRAYLLTTAAQFDRLADYATTSASTTHAA